MHELVAGLAFALDTLPDFGRLILQAVTLSVALTVATRWLPLTLGDGVNILYRKGALLALAALPPTFFLFEIQLPVPVEELPPQQWLWPLWAAWGLFALWAAGALFALWRVYRALVMVRTHLAGLSPANDKVLGRLSHWRYRLNDQRHIEVCCGGGAMPWHWVTPRRAVIVLPAAANHWPIGVVDVALLNQLASIQQRGWIWLAFGRVVAALYWPAPWVAQLGEQLAAHGLEPALNLAEAAYRDKEGWRRDWRQLEQRTDGLSAKPETGELLLPSTRLAPAEVPEPVPYDQMTPRERHRARTKDPHEQAYWLIAGASLVVSTLTLLTLVQAPPEFEPSGYLQLKWNQKTVRTIKEYGEEYEGRPPLVPIKAPSAAPSGEE